MNFCMEEVGTTISADKVEADGNEAKMLLDTSKASSKPVFGLPPRGFLTDNFVRTPVTISVKFPVCIEISHITINPKFGTQTSSAFSIETDTSSRGIPNKQVVGKEFLNSGVPSRIIFRNPRFSLRPPFSLLKNSPFRMSETEGNPTVFNLKHPNVQACERVTGLHITILRVQGSSVPALGGLQVWGQPSVTCPTEIVNKLLVKWMRKIKKPEEISDSTMVEEPAAKRMKLSNETTVAEIPEEFLDPITQELMYQPIRLPCGKAVDASTLEKYYQEEAVWGRPPNNPFTSQPYTDNIKPISDAVLKSRIDYFLTQHADNPNFRQIPRVLGNGTTKRSHSFPHLQSRKRQVITSSTAASGLQLSCFQPATSISKSTSTTTSTSSAGATAATLFPTTAQWQKEESKTSSTTHTVTLEPCMSMEDRLQAELSKVLGRGDSYLFNSSASHDNKNKCRECSQLWTQGGSPANVIWYSSSCEHVLLCRPCMVKLNKDTPFTCSYCGQEWTVRDLHRTHV